MNPIIPILILFLGAAAMLLGPLMPNSRTGGLALIAVGASIVALLAGLFQGFSLPSQFTLSTWPSQLFQMNLSLATDRVSWLFELALLVVCAAACLTGLARAGGPRLGARAVTLLITAVALAAVQSENFITLAITWAVLDGIYFLSLLLLSRGENLESQATLSLTFNSLATFCLVAAALDVMHSGQTTFVIGQTQLSEQATLWLLLAVVFRLGVFPFHLSIPGESNVRQGLGTLLRLAPVATAFDLLVHVVIVSPDLPLKPWLSAAACLGLLIGAAQLWDTSEPRAGLSFAVLAQSSLAVLLAVWGGAEAGAGVLALGLATLLGGAVLFLNNGFDAGQRWWSIPTFIGAFAFLGGPLTVGYLGAVILYSSFLSGGWLLFLVCVIGQALLTAGCLRIATWPGEPVPRTEPIAGVSYLFGLAAPLLMAFLAGVASVGLIQAANAGPVSLFSPTAFVALGALVVAGLAGFALWRFEPVVRARTQSAWTAATSVARLGWLYTSFWETYRLLGRMLRAGADIVEGEGGVLWTIVAALLVWLLFRSR